MPRPNTARTRNLSKRDINTIKRLLKYFDKYKFRFIFVLVCIVISAAASVGGSLFIQVLIDKYITPMLLNPNPSYDGLFSAISKMALLYITGVLSSFAYSRIMVYIAQGIL